MARTTSIRSPIAAAIVALAVAAGAQSWTVDAPSCVDLGGSIDVVIRTNSGAFQQAAAQWQLTWDAAALALAPGFGSGGIQFGPGWDGAANTSVPGQIWVASFYVSSPGPAGANDQATLRFNQVGGGGPEPINGIVEIWATPAFGAIGNPPFAMNGDSVLIDCAASPCPLAVAECGDCNGDGIRNILDSLTAAQIAVSLIAPDIFQFARCNVSGAVDPAPGAIVNIIDALTLAQGAAGLPVTLSCC